MSLLTAEDTIMPDPDFFLPEPELDWLNTSPEKITTESPLPSAPKEITPIKKAALKWKNKERRPLADITSLPYKKRLTPGFEAMRVSKGEKERIL